MTFRPSDFSDIAHTHTPDDVIKHALSQGAAKGIKVRSKLWTEYIYIYTA